MSTNTAALESDLQAAVERIRPYRRSDPTFARALIVAALRDVSSQPGSPARPELGEGVRSWHLRLSREHARTDTGIVCRPRHFLIYRAQSQMTVIGRVLHDSLEPTQHLGSEDSWE